MFDRSTHDLQNVFFRQNPMGGVAPSRYELANHQNRLKRLATLEAEADEKRRQRAEARLDASASNLSRFLRAVSSLFDTCNPRRRHSLK